MSFAYSKDRHRIQSWKGWPKVSGFVWPFPVSSALRLCGVFQPAVVAALIVLPQQVLAIVVPGFVLPFFGQHGNQLRCANNIQPNAARTVA